jgi:hypothetical protein
MDNENNNKYIHPVEELDKIIDQMNRGITPMMDDQLQLEIKLRFKELQQELFDSDEDELDERDIAIHKEMMQKHLEKKKREATKNDVIIIKLTDEHEARLAKDMGTSIVRTDPNSTYNIPDSELYSSEERRIIHQKLSRIKNCYYNQIDYVNAIKILKEAIEFSLENDYPWLSKEEAIRQFSEGKIKFTYCNLPKLYINYNTQITDPKILKGVVTGEITLKNKDEKPVKKHNKSNSEPIQVDYNVISESDFNRYAQLHSQGYDTPISAILRAKSTIYNRFTLPSNNRFSLNGNNNRDNNEPLLFDWTKEGAGRAYFNMKHGKKTTSGEIIQIVNEQNDNMLNNIVKSNTVSFLQSMKQIDSSRNNTGKPTEVLSTSLQVNPEAAQIEQNILNAIRANNPLK